MPKSADSSALNPSFSGYDPAFQLEMQRLHRLTVYARWFVVAVLWVFVAPLSLWALRGEIELWLEYFTWTAVRFTIAYNPLPAFGLSLCIGFTVTVLVWQSRNILRGISTRQVKRLEKQLHRIHQQGPSHPLWKWVCEESSFGD